MEVELRHITPDELPTMGLVLTGAFGSTIPPDDLHRFGKNLDLERTFCCFDGDVMVGTSGNYSLTMTIPGGQVACAGVTMVSVRASHTRRGLMRRMMRALLDDAKERGEPLAALWASEENIYQRFGFGLAANEGHMDVVRQRLQFLDDPGPTGRVRLIELDDAPKLLPAIYDRLLPEVPGMLARTDNWWKWHRLLDTERHRGGGSPLNCAVFDVDGDDRGYVLYRHHPKWTHGGTSDMWLNVEEVLGLDSIATRELWRFVFSIDLVERVRASWLPSDLPLVLMATEPRRLSLAASESLWVRLVDVEKALRARSRTSDARVVIDVVDEFCPWNQGRYAVSAAAVERTEAEADLRLGAGALAAVYLGEFTFHQLARALRAQELRPGALDEADRIFWTPRAPWCPENF